MSDMNTNTEPDTGMVELTPMVPDQAPSATSAPLNDTARLLPPAELAAHDAALTSLARAQANSAARAGNVRLG